MIKPEAEYLEYLAVSKGYSQHTVENYQRDIERFLLFLSKGINRTKEKRKRKTGLREPPLQSA